MAGAFQANAFQNNAFQTDGTFTPSVPPSSHGGGGHVRGHKKHRLGLYWPKLTKKRTEEDVVAIVIQEVLENETVVAPIVDIGALAGALIETYSYDMLRHIESQERFLDLIKRELEEMDDEEALIWLL